MKNIFKQFKKHLVFRKGKKEKSKLIRWEVALVLTSIVLVIELLILGQFSVIGDTSLLAEILSTILPDQEFTYSTRLTPTLINRNTFWDSSGSQTGVIDEIAKLVEREVEGGDDIASFNRENSIIVSESRVFTFEAEEETSFPEESLMILEPEATSTEAESGSTTPSEVTPPETATTTDEEVPVEEEPLETLPEEEATSTEELPAEEEIPAEEEEPPTATTSEEISWLDRLINRFTTRAQEEEPAEEEPAEEEQAEEESNEEKPIEEEPAEEEAQATSTDEGAEEPLLEEPAPDSDSVGTTTDDSVGTTTPEDEAILPTIDGEEDITATSTSSGGEGDSEEEETKPEQPAKSFSRMKELIISGFTSNAETTDPLANIKKITLNASMAIEGSLSPEHIFQIQYRFNQDESWQELESFDDTEKYQNRDGGNYFTYELIIGNRAFLVDDLKNLEVRFVALSQKKSDEDLVLLLDALWLDIHYQTADIIELLSERNGFMFTENPSFAFEYKSQKSLAEKVGDFIIGEKPADFSVETIEISDPYKEEVPLQTFVAEESGNWELEINGESSQEELESGKYALRVEVQEGEESYAQVVEFYWGVLSVNTNKSIYLPGSEAYIQMAALTNEGHTICDANLKLEIITPDGSVFTPDIEFSGQCGPDNIVDVPDYFAHQQLSQTGNYLMHLIRLDENGQFITDIISSFEVREAVSYDIERTGPTRIYPFDPVFFYPVGIRITANEAFSGTVNEFVPGSFEVKQYGDGTIKSEGDFKTISWDVVLNQGETIQLSYAFDAPDVSPEYYLLGPLRMEGGETVFEEARQWQIASDAEIVVDAAILDATDEFGPSPAVVFTTTSVGYTFFVDGTTQDLVYVKTSDGGSTWGSVQTIDSATAGWTNVSVWYDQWTPGDTSGTKIHIAASDDTVTTGADIYYTYLDTSTDTLKGSMVKALDGTTFTEAVNAAPSITRGAGVGGSLFIAANFADYQGSAGGAVAKSTDGAGDSWTDITPSGWSTVSVNQIQLLPLDTDDDIIAIKADTGSNYIRYRIYDEVGDSWAGSWSELSGSAVSLTDSGTYDQWFSATIKKSTGDVYLVFSNYIGNSGNDIEFWSFSDSGRTWTQGENVVTDDATAIAPVPLMDENTGDLYVAYLRGTLASVMHTYFRKLTSGETSWSDELQRLSLLGDDCKSLRGNLLSTQRLFVSWYDDDDNVIYGSSILAEAVPVEQYVESAMFDATDEYGPSPSVVFTDDQTGYQFYIKADTTFDGTDEYGPSPAVVFTSSTVGYVFFVDLYSQSLVYRKTENGGILWGNSVIIDTAQTGWTSVAVWYDQWTPGDSSGTKIHIAASDDASDDIFYTHLDTNGDTLKGSMIAAVSGSVTLTEATDGPPGITKGGGGSLFISGNFTDAVGGKVSKSTDGAGDVWNDVTPSGWSSVAADQIQLLPLDTDDDIIAIKADTANDYIRYQIYDEAGDAWAGSWSELGGSAVTLVDDATYDQWFSATIKKSTGDVYLAFANNTNVTGNDIEFWSFSDSSRTWTQGGNVITDGATIISPVPLVEEDTGYIYVAYLKGTVGSSTRAYYKRSTTGGVSWDSESSTVSPTLADDYRYLRGNLLNNDILYIIWHNDDTNHLRGNNLLSPASLDNPIADQKVVYGKTTDGGLHWESAGVTGALYGNVAGAGGSTALAVWYDQWTPGSTSGTKIHIAFSDDHTDDYFYTYLDTSDDTPRAYPIAVIAGSVITELNVGVPGITKGGGDGALFLSGNFNTTAGGSVYKSTDGGDNWSNVTPSGWSSAATDQIQLLPLKTNNDIMAIRAETTSNYIRYRIYGEAGDAWAGSWSELGVSAVSLTDNTTYDQWFSASIKKSTGDTYLAFANYTANATNDIEFWSFSDSGRTWTQGGNVITNDDTVMMPVPLIDENTGDIYAAYLKGTLETAMGTYYKKSTDGGANWGSQSANLSLGIVDDHKALRGNLFSTERLYVVWYNDDLDDIMGSTVAYPGFSVSGVFYQGDESTPDPGQCNGSTKNLTLLVNGTASTTTSCKATTGAFTFTGVVANAGDTITIYSTGADKANRAYVSDGTADTGMSLYENTVVVADDNDGTLSIMDTIDYDNTDNATDMLFDATDASPDTFVVDDTAELHIWDGDNFTPGGTITTSPSADGTDSNKDGDIHIDGSGTLDMGTNALSVGGDFNNEGTMSYSGGQATTFTATATGHTIIDGGENFEIIAFEGSSGGWSFADATTINVGLVMIDGTLSGTVDITINGGVAIGYDDGDINLTGGTFLLDGELVDGPPFGFGSDADWDFYNLTFGDGSGVATTTAGGAGDHTIANNLVIAANQTFVSLAGQDLTIAGDMSVNTGNLTGTGTITVNGGGVTGDGDINLTAGTFLLDGAGNFGGATSWDFYNLLFGDGSDVTQTTAVGSGDHTVASNFTVAANQTFQGISTQNLTIGDDFTNESTFIPNSNTVIFNNASNTSALNYSSDTPFYNLTVATAGKAMQFDEAQKTTVTGTLSIQGTDCTTGRVFLDSYVNDNQWDIETSGASVDIDYADIEDSNALTAITGTDNSTADNNNNTNWTINAGVCVGGFSVGGVFYQADESTPDPGQCNGSTQNLTLRVNGLNPVTAYCTGTTGVFTFTGVSASAGDTITIYSTGADKANRAYVSDGTVDSGMSLFENTVIVADDNDGTVTIPDLWDYDNTDNDTDMLFDATDDDPDTFVVDDGAELHIWDGDNFTPGGTITTSPSADGTDSNKDGDIHIDGTATLGMEANELSVGGDFNNEGTMSYSGGQPTGFYATAVGHTIADGGENFKTVGFVGSSGGWSFVDTTIIDENLYMVDGTLSGTTDITINGGTVVGMGGDINLTGGTFLVDGDGGGFGGDINWDFYNLTFGDGLGTETTSATGAGDHTIANNLTVATNQTFQSLAGQDLTITGDLFVNIGNLTGTGTITVNGGAVTGDGDINLTAGTFLLDGAGNFGGTTSWDFYNLTFGDGADTTQTTAVGAGSTVIAGTLTIATNQTLELDTNDKPIDANGDVTIDGTLSASDSAAFTASGDWTNDGTFTANDGTITLDGDTDNDVNGGSSSFYNLALNKSAVSGWSSGNAIGLQWNDDGGSLNSRFMSYSYEGGDPPILTITVNGGSPVEYDVSTGADDGNASQGDINSDWNEFYTGWSTDVWESWFRFPSISVAPEATISSASLKVRAKGLLGSASDARTKIAAVDEDDHASPTDYDEWNADHNMLTDAAVDWDPSAWISDTWYESPDIKDVIQEIVDRTDQKRTVTLAGNDLEVDNDLTIGADSTLDVSASNCSSASCDINVGGDWTNSGTFTERTGAVVFDGTGTSTLTGATTFYDFTSTTANKTLLFEAGTIFGIDGKLTLVGTDGNEIILNSTDDDGSPTQWDINHQGTESIAYADIKNSGCDVASTYVSLNSTDINSGNNDSCWLFPDLSFTLDSISKNLDLGISNDFTDTDTSILTVTSRSAFGYQVKAYQTDNMIHVANPLQIITDWLGTNTVPTLWTGTCTDDAECGWGYNTDDADLTQFAADEYAGFVEDEPGDTVAESTGPVTGDVTTITYKTSVLDSQAAGTYRTVIRYIITPEF